MKRKLVKNLWIVYRNELKQYHREKDNPSVISFHGSIYFCKNGKEHRKDKPSVIYPDGTLEYWENDELVKEIEI